MSVFAQLQKRSMTSRELQQALGVSQATISNQINALGQYVVQLPDGRAPKYALTTNAFGSGDSIPINRLDNHGNHLTVGLLRPLMHGGYLLQKQTSCSDVLLGSAKNGIYDDLPYFLQFLRPQGFIGNHIAAELNRISDKFPSNPQYWSESQLGKYLLSRGEDLPGNFIVGDTSLLRRQEINRRKRIDYPAMADRVEAGEPPGSSAGGEQPKFTCFSEDGNAHVIVKFTSKQNTRSLKRWSDVLITENLANQILNQSGIPSAISTIFVMDGRTFLESTRFDRIGLHGRRSMLSMQYVDAEFVGSGTSWIDTAKALVDQQLLNNTHLYNIAMLHEFGRRINNTDMHLGNLSLGIEGNVFCLLPTYDMCSMGFAPKRDIVSELHFDWLPVKGIEPDTNPALAHATLSAALLAEQFWISLGNQAGISDELKVFLKSKLPDSQARIEQLKKEIEKRNRN